jgi:hypothetical protein
MSHNNLVFCVSSILLGVLVLTVWNNPYAHAQQSSSLAIRSADSNVISPDIKAKMCDPGNPSLKVVNTTEAHVCGIPKTVKPSLPAATQAVSSTTQQTAVNPVSTSASVNASPKQQQVPSTTAISQSTTGAKRTTSISPVSSSSLSKKSLSSPALDIAPQQHQMLPVSNVTGLQNYTLSSISQLTDTGNLLYLGYHGSSSLTGTSITSSSDNHDDSSSKHTDNSKSESSTHHNDNGPTGKKKASDSNSDSTNNNNGDQGSSRDKATHGSNKSSSDLGSSIKNKVHSIIKHALG